MARRAIRRKTTAKSTARKPRVGELIPQGHGGALRNGGTNRGGPGRPRSAIRDACARSFDERIAVAEKIADSRKATRLDKLRALDLLGKYGGLHKIEHGGSVGLDETLKELADRERNGAAT